LNKIAPRKKVLVVWAEALSELLFIHISLLKYEVSPKLKELLTRMENLFDGMGEE